MTLITITRLRAQDGIQKPVSPKLECGRNYDGAMEYRQVPNFESRMNMIRHGNLFMLPRHLTVLGV
jgi:hypothetical protein